MADVRGYGEFRRGWTVVLSSMIGIGVGLSPMPFYTMGIFAPHLVKTFGWSMGEVMGGLTVTSLMVLWAGPLAGILALKFGARRVAITSLLLFGLAFAALALSNGSLTLYYVTWGAVAVLGAGTLPITWTRAVNHWFEARKGLALGLSLMGTGIFGFFCKPLTNWLIGDFGWRGGYVGLALLPLLVATPVALLLFRDTDSHADVVVHTTVPGGLTLGQTLREWRFWLLALTILPLAFALAGPVPNLETILRVGGVDAATILGLTPFIGLSAIAGRLAGGWLLDRFWAPAVGFVILSLPGISCWILAHGPLDPQMAMLSILLIGFALGIEYDLIAFFVARYFGLRSYSAIYGLLYVSFALGSGAAPLVFGRWFDAHKNYSGILMISLGILLVSAALLLLLGRYRVYADEEISSTNMTTA